MEDTFNIVGIDPGKNTGVSIYKIALPSYKIVSIHTMLYELDKFDPIDSTKEDAMFSRLSILEKAITAILLEYKPLAVAWEAAFMNTRFATAVIQLTRYTSTIDRTIRCFDPMIKIYNYPPKWIKKYVGAGGTADKHDMLSNLLKIGVIASKLELSRLSEHEIDATSIAYVLYNDILATPWVLYTL